jgi:signal transduction histidine kinase
VVLSIRTRILLFQLVAGLAVLAMLAAGILAMRSYDHHRTRGALAHRQLDALATLAIEADQYSEAVATLLVTAATERLEVARLHSRIQLSFQRLQRATEEEYEFLARDGAGEERDLVRNRRLFQLYADMNARIAALFTMRDAGQSDVAARVFYGGIDRGLDDEFEGLISEAVADELAEVERADRAAEQVADAARWLIAATAALAVIGVIVAGFRLNRSIGRPVRKLMAGAVALGRGDLAHRVGPLGSDELGLLARRFDEMAERIARQRAMLVDARSHLEREVAARTGELRLANERLERQDRSRVRFLADVSHELRTPLTILRGEAEVTLRNACDDLAAHRRALERIVDQAHAMGRLVDDLMTLARAETEDITFANALVDLHEISADAVREATVLGRAKDITIRSSLGGVLPVEGDPQRMKQIVMILLDNAVKYSPEGEAVEVSVSGSADAVVVAVSNRAPHLGEIDLQHVFDRFYRGRQAPAGVAEGSGLGLPIARWLAEKQGGSIALRRDGDRLAVSVRFPAACADPDEPEAMDEPPLAAE